MKKNLAKKVTLSILAGAVLLSSGVANGATVTSTPGTSPDWKVAISGYTENLDLWHADGNDVELSAGSSNHFTGGFANSGNVEDCNVTLNGGNFFGLTVFGGYVKDEGNVLRNVVNINGNVGVTHQLHAALTFKGKAEYNVININGDIEAFAIYSGYAREGEANNNEINIYGGNIESPIFVGHAGVGKVSNNKIKICLSKAADLSKSYLYGSAWYLGDFIMSSYNRGNHLEIKSTTESWDGKVKRIEGFDKIIFDEVVWGNTPLTIEEHFAVGYDSIDPLFESAFGDVFKGETKIDVNKISGDIVPNDTMTLIEANGGIVKTSIDPQNVSEPFVKKPGTITKQKVTIDDTVANVHNGIIYQDGNSIKLQLEDDSMNQQVLVIGESRAAATAFTNQGSELVETGIDALARDNTKAGDTKVFAALYGNASEYATGSHVKVNGFSGFVGVGKTNANGLTVGAFFENGEGNYRTYNTLDGEFMRGDGEANYNGGGFLVRKDNANGVYTEASLRAGNLQNELRNAVKGSEGLAGYDIDTFYYGAHVGIGKVIPRGNDGDSIDVYGKFIYTHHDSENFKIDGDEFHFDSVDSERLRLGFRINEVQNNKLNMYYGAAWEYEFGGDADNTVIDYDLATPTLGGSTVIGEIGAHYKASDKWSIDLNGRAYVGQREGFSGSVQANYAF